MTMVGSNATNGGGLSPLEAAREWTKRGNHVIPIPYREKGPKISCWQKLRLKLDDLPKYFNSKQQNVGVLHGEPFGHADVDVDCPEALKLWPGFAVPTGLVFGRQSKPFSHWFYRIDPPVPSMEFVDPIDHVTLVELRCLTKDGNVGMQTVVPPSVHKDTGETLRFELKLDGEPANVDADVLVRAVEKTAAAALIARRYPDHGRHYTELAFAGVLARGGWEEDQVKEFIVAVYRAVPTHDPNAVQRVARAVEDTFRKYAEGAEITGIPRLCELIDKKVVDVALRWLRIDQQPAAAAGTSDWRENLLRNNFGNIKACVQNALIGLEEARMEWGPSVR
jgi:hypothetical protein